MVMCFSIEAKERVLPTETILVKIRTKKLLKTLPDQSSIGPSFSKFL